MTGGDETQRRDELYDQAGRYEQDVDPVAPGEETREPPSVPDGVRERVQHPPAHAPVDADGETSTNG